ncbi:MAG: NifB/NifX family molybdenum-iron cluster-binding protein [Syntrophomonadaceae bacterium]|nr:NifB/NifX family molybdenum-iron cluster-binding protein [Syntrophomonadaceae bacterium]
MLVAVAQENEMVCQHFGHCECFALYDTDNHNLSQVNNPGHEPGFLPGFLGQMGVKLIIAGGMGGRAQDLFAGQGIEVIVGVNGSVKNALDRYLKGELKSSGSVCSEHQHAGDCHS